MQMSVRNWFTRAVWIKVHLYLAVWFGLLFVLIGLSGSVCVYRAELDEWFNPELYIAEPAAHSLSLDKILAAVRAAHPDRFGVWTLEMPRTPHGVVTAWFDKPRETVGDGYAPLMVSVNPYTGEVLANRFWGQTLLTWLVDFHAELQLAGEGRQYVAWLAVFLLLSVLSGVYLWWPGWRELRHAFKIRHQAGVRRFLLDLHRLGGLLSAGLLVLLAFTGLHLAYPVLLETLTAAEGMGHGDAGPNVHSSAVPNKRPVSLSEAVLVARGLFPSADIRRITTPLGENGTYRVNLRQHQELNQQHPLTTVWIDRWSGQIQAVQNPAKFSAGQSFVSWLWPLHTGEAVGGLGRFFWCLTGLTPLLLLVSGILHYLYRQGVVADRQVDFAGFWQNVQSKMMGVWRVGRKVLLLMLPGFRAVRNWFARLR